MVTVLRSFALLVALFLAGAPALAEDPPAAPAVTEAKPEATQDAMIGEVVALPTGRSAAYGTSRVQGPGVNLTDAGNGEWKGNIRDLDGVFKVTEKRISGANFNMVMDRDADEWTFQGTVNGRRVRIVLGKDGLVVRYDTRFYEMKRAAPDLWATIPTGPAVRVKGDAAGPDPVYPQFVFALLAVL